MNQLDARSGLQAMDRDECLHHLSGEAVGRLAVIHAGSPMIYPVNFVVSGEDITFRSDSGTKIEAGLRSPVCFEADHLNPRTHAGWSVVITGRLEEALPHRPDGWQQVLALPAQSWAGDKQRLFRIVADRITGRRVGPPTRREPS